ncbi:MAG: hydrolase [Firmicutes bacterium]|nr:hydrolase [Bacillota bacterium]
MSDKSLFNLERTALIIVDLQQGIVGMPASPHPAPVRRHHEPYMALGFRASGGLVVLVHVGPSPDGKDSLRPITDEAAKWPSLPEGWDTIVPELGPQPEDVVIRKRQWGAFYGTDLDLELRRRGKDSIVLCGISTNYGVESTARDAYERGYQQIFVEDACSARSEEDHVFAMTRIFPRIGRVRSTQAVLEALIRR